jgi:hypothetical protein
MTTSGRPDDATGATLPSCTALTITWMRVATPHFRFMFST